MGDESSERTGIGADVKNLATHMNIVRISGGRLGPYNPFKFDSLSKTDARGVYRDLLHLYFEIFGKEYQRPSVV